MDRHFSGNGQSTHSREDVEHDMEFGLCSSGAYYDTPHHIPQDSRPYIPQNAYGELHLKHNLPSQIGIVDPGLPLHASDYTPASNVDYHPTRTHQRNASSSTQSSHSSSYRSSSGSSYSQWQLRYSTASANSTWSQISAFSEDQHVTQAGCAQDAPLTVTSSTPLAALGGSAVEPPAKGTPTPRQQAPQNVGPPASKLPKKEPFQTCVSRKKRSRSAQQLARYWCTSCGEGFKEKYDWKRHEETYQERTEMFACELCNNVYFLDKDFLHHHQKSHRCRVCVEKQHVEQARKPRMTRTGWGCGFCSHFSSNWAERCNHISKHFEKEEKTMDDWHHSQVIFSLLQRTEILRYWCRLLEIKQRTGSPFRWRRHNTARVEGFPESNAKPQLQDLLEYYNSDYGSSVTIVQLAFETGLMEKELPRPPVNEKDAEAITGSSSQGNLHAFAQDDVMSEVAQWPFLDPIPEDPFQATDVCTLGCDALHDAFNDGHDFHPFQ